MLEDSIWPNYTEPSTAMLASYHIVVSSHKALSITIINVVVIPTCAFTFLLLAFCETSYLKTLPYAVAQTITLLQSYFSFTFGQGTVLKTVLPTTYKLINSGASKAEVVHTHLSMHKGQYSLDTLIA